MSKYKQELGKAGEELAITHLRNIGYHILKQNYRYGRSEIDIIARQKDVIVFVEVKTRETHKYGSPEDAVSNAKIKKIAEGAEGFLLEAKVDLECRYDIISIIKNKQQTEVTHIVDAFWPGLY
jgi:putative endonuclease